MAGILPTDFVWQRDEAGYELIPRREPSEYVVGFEKLEEQLGLRPPTVSARGRAPTDLGRRLIHALPRTFPPGIISAERIIGRGGRQIKYRPADVVRPLFPVFASAAKSKEGLLDFANRFGPLIENYNVGGEDVQYGLIYGRFMNTFLALPPHEQARYLLQLPSGPGLDCARVDVVLTANSATDELQLKFEPRSMSLIRYMMLELALSLAGGNNIRQCRLCGIWFEAGKRRGRREDAQYCSDEHRILFNSRKRSQKGGS